MSESKFLSRRTALLLFAGSATLIAAPIALQIPAAMAEDSGGNSGGSSDGGKDNENDNNDDNESDDDSTSSTSTTTTDDDKCPVGTNCNKD